MELQPLAEMVGDFPNLCGAWDKVKEVPAGKEPARRSVEGGLGPRVNGTEYLELIEQAGVREGMLPSMRPLHQGKLFERIVKWEPGAADKAIAEIKREQPNLGFEGGMRCSMCWFRKPVASGTGAKESGRNMPAKSAGAARRFFDTIFINEVGDGRD